MPRSGKREWARSEQKWEQKNNEQKNSEWKREWARSILNLLKQYSCYYYAKIQIVKKCIKVNQWLVNIS